MKLYTFADVVGRNLYAKLRDSETGESEFIVSESLLDTNTYSTNPIDLYYRDMVGQHKSLEGYPLTKVEFSTIAEAKQWVSKNRSSAFGQTDFVYTWIAQNFQGVTAVDKVFVTGIIDIENAFKRGKAFDKNDFSGKILSITMHDTKTGQDFLLGYHDSYEEPGVTYIKCADEKELLLKIAQWIHAADIDFITGWNSEEYDVHYIYQRMLINKMNVNMLSPFYKESSNDKLVSEKEGIVSIIGITSLDYMKLFMKYTVKNLPSFSLSYVSKVHLNDDKIDYKDLGYIELMDLYERNPTLFYEYNVHDVRLVKKLNNKLKFISLAIAMAYTAGIRFGDVFSQIRFWDTYIYSTLKQDGIIIPPRKHSTKGAFEGAFVKPVITGFHKWMASFDYTSLYPSIMRTFNISYETFVKMIPIEDVPKYRSGKLKLEKDLCVAANGAVYRTDVQGIMPRLVTNLFNERKYYQKLMKDAKKQVEQLGDDAPQELIDSVILYDILQLVRKYAINSAYGILGSEFYRYYKLENAEAITSTGQMLIKETVDVVNDYLNTINGSTNVDYIVAGDTDSIYVTLEKVVNKFIDKDWQEAANDGELYSYMEKQCA